MEARGQPPKCYSSESNHLDFWDRIPHWLGACQLGWVSWPQRLFPLPRNHGIHNENPLHPTFSHGIWGLNSGPCDCSKQQAVYWLTSSVLAYSLFLFRRSGWKGQVHIGINCRDDYSHNDCSISKNEARFSRVCEGSCLGSAIAREC